MCPESGNCQRLQNITKILRLNNLRNKGKYFEKSHLRPCPPFGSQGNWMQGLKTSNLLPGLVDCDRSLEPASNILESGR